MAPPFLFVFRSRRCCFDLHISGVDRHLHCYFSSNPNASSGRVLREVFDNWDMSSSNA